MIYDAHTYLGVDPSWGAWGLPVPLEGKQWVQLMDEAGITGVCVAPPDPGVVDDFRPDNERIAKAIREYPGRFFGYARAKPKRGQAALDDLRCWVEERGFHAVMMSTIDEYYQLIDRNLVDPVVETASQLNVPVFFHTDDSFGATSTPSMVADIAADFPNTTFIIGPAGGASGGGGWNGEILPALKRSSNTVIAIDADFRPNIIQPAVEAVGADRILMGSRAPYSPAALMPIFFRDHLPALTPEQKEAIMGRNLIRILGIEQ